MITKIYTVHGGYTKTITTKSSARLGPTKNNIQKRGILYLGVTWPKPTPGKKPATYEAGEKNPEITNLAAKIIPGYKL